MNRRKLHMLHSGGLLFLLAVFSILAILEMRHLMDGQTGLTRRVSENMASSGVEHPLTAVLLNFRGYDTLLEIGVLFVAVIAVRSINTAPVPAGLRQPAFMRYTVLRVALAVLVPSSIMMAGYMVWVGAYAPGGAFQSGVVIGALWIVLLVTGVFPSPIRDAGPIRAVLAFGFLVFLCAALMLGMFSGQLLQYPEPVAGILILIIEVSLSLSIGASIGVLFSSVFQKSPDERDALRGGRR